LKIKLFIPTIHVIKSSKARKDLNDKTSPSFGFRFYRGHP
jgi:hypothetical protein